MVGEGVLLAKITLTVMTVPLVLARRGKNPSITMTAPPVLAISIGGVLQSEGGRCGVKVGCCRVKVGCCRVKAS